MHPNPLLSENHAPGVPVVLFDRVHACQRAPRRLLLDGVTFVAEAGQITALAGSGWATLHHCARALLGSIEVDAGEILLQGGDLGSVPASRMRHSIGWIPWVTSAQGTIIERLRAPCPAVGTAEIERVIEVVGLRETIAGLADGYESPFAHPSLSPAIHQRIELAAALLGRKPVILIEEPGPELAEEDRTILLAVLASLRGCHTILVLARSIASTRMADSIVLLEAGRVVEEGPHEALLNWGDRYAQLVRAPDGLL